MNLCGLLAFGSTIRPLQPLGQPSHLRWPPEGPTHRFILRSLCISSFFSPRFTCTPSDRLPAHLHYALIQFSLNQWGQICLQSICMADFMQSCGHIIHLPPRNLNKFGRHPALSQITLSGDVLCGYSFFAQDLRECRLGSTQSTCALAAPARLGYLHHYSTGAWHRNVAAYAGWRFPASRQFCGQTLY